MYRKYSTNWAWWGIVIAVASVWFVPTEARTDWIPFVRATIEQEYDSNIFLDPDGYHRPGTNKSDFITTVTPAIGIRNETEVQTVSAEYEFNYSYFVNNSDQSYAGHAGNFEFDRQISDRLRIYMHDRLEVSEEPRNDTYDYVTVNYGRMRNLRNDAEAGLEYTFARDSTVRFYYMDDRLDYLDDSGYRSETEARFGMDDSVTYGPGLEMEYWLNQFHGVSLAYEWVRTDYKIRPSERRDRVEAGYTYRFSPHTAVRCDFSLEYIDSKGPLLFDYKIYQVTVGLNKVFSPEWTLDLFGGFYYRPSGDLPDEFDSSDNEGFSGGFTLSYIQEVWRVTLAGEAGARVEYGDYNNRGYTPYRNISLDFNYQLGPRLNFYLGASYDYEKSPDTYLALARGDHRRETYDVTTRLEYQILPWLTSSAEYEYAEESATDYRDGIPGGYKDHRCVISLSATYDWL